MQRIWTFLFDPRTLAVIGLVALATFLLLGADVLKLGIVWALVAFGVLLLGWGLWRAFQWWRSKRAAQQFEQGIDGEAERAAKKASGTAKRAEVAALRERMQEAVKTLKHSKIGVMSGSQALYELPWYMVIGNPAAGKSSAITMSGLKFPFSDNSGAVIHGIGGTRNCDWFFTTEGILLDTAGRYSVHEEDREEWLGFLSLLRRYRPKAPINGIILAVSVAELAGKKPDFTIQLAKQLRQRVQELTENLAVFAPVYVLFTKADLIAGFAEFFEDGDRDERERVWGATLPYDAPHKPGGEHKSDAIALFDKHFDELYQGLKAASVARMSLQRGEAMSPGVLSFPLEFATLKPSLRTFISTLFEDNPYQFRPIFRGFYFTSAVQEGVSTSRASERVAQRFGLQVKPHTTTAQVFSRDGFFLKQLFSKVIFADRNLVKQYASPVKARWRRATFAASVALLATMLGLWSWSYVGNRQLVANVQADLDKAVKLQASRTDLQSRLEALELLQDRLVQLQSFRESRPWSVSLGLYQGEAIEQLVQREYFTGIRELMLKPVAGSIEAYLAEVNASAAELKPAIAGSEAAAPTPVSTRNSNAAAGSPYTSASPTNVNDAYNALKTYVMLADRSRIEPGHLSDQVTRFWRVWLEANRGVMPRERMIRGAERVLSFALSQMAHPDFPQIQNNLGVLDQTRENLRRVVRGMPARERVYGEIRARASTRFAPMTVARIVDEADKDIVAGSYAISGAFTRDAWEKYVEDAIKDAAYKELQSEDWVLKTSARDDLSLEGSPEQIQKALIQMYKTEYVREWQKFVQGVSVAEFGSFEQAVVRMNRLGDPAASPVGKLMQTLYDETSWDNPSLLNDRLAKTQQGFIAWIKRVVLGQSPSQVQVNVNVQTGQAAIPMGPIGKEFAGLSRLMMSRDNSPTLMKTYLETLAKVRSRFNQIKTQGDPGPAARQLMQQTLEGSGSELSDALRLVDEQMLNGMTDTARSALRPLLVRPLLQAFDVVVKPTEAELNRSWTAQVYEPFQRTLADKYPFLQNARVEASPADIAKIFGTDGAIAKFADKSLGALVTRRGDVLTQRTWGDLGIRLTPAFNAGFPAWVAPLGGASGGGNGAAGGGASGEAQTMFQILPQPASGLTEYTIEIDGQTLRYRNTAASWTNFVWPSQQGAPGVRISGVTFDGRSVEFINHPGRFGLEKMIESAQRRKLDGGGFELKWPSGDLAVPVHLRIVSAPGAGAGAGAPAAAAGGNGLKGVTLPATIAGVVEAGPPVAQASAQGARQ
jgi:type VI secretion system protein ImpL